MENIFYMVQSILFDSPDADFPVAAPHKNEVNADCILIRWQDVNGQNIFNRPPPHQNTRQKKTTRGT